MGEEGFNFGATHVLGMALVVKQNMARDPVDVSFLGADGIVFEAYGIADLIEEFLGSRLHRFSLRKHLD